MTRRLGTRHSETRRAAAMDRRVVLRAAGALTLGLGPTGLLQAIGRMQTEPGRAALGLAEGSRGELVSLLESLVAIRSHSGESARRAQAVVAEFMTAAGYRAESSADAPSGLADHPEFMPPSPPGDGPFVNLVGHPPEAGAVPFGIFAHIDTEMPGDGWETEPYRVTKVDGRLHGLGTADDKGGVAAMLVAAALLQRTGGPLPTIMSLHGKGGGSRGSLPVFERFARQGVGFDAVLYAHPAETGRGLVDIKHVVQGSLDLTLTVTGWRGEPLEINSAESAPYDTGGDALRACWGVIEHLRAHGLAGFEVNVGELEAGDRVGAVPQSAKARIRVLFESDRSWGELLAELRGQMRAYLADLPTAGGEYGGTLEQSGLATNSGRADWDAPASRSLRGAVADVTGVEPRPYRNHYAGDIRYPIRLLGAPAYGIGSLGGDFYGPNEWVDEDDLVVLVAAIVETVRRWATLGG